MAVTYTHKTPRDDCPIRKVMVYTDHGVVTFIKLSFQVGKPCRLHADMRRVITKSKRRARVKLGEIHIIIVAGLGTEDFFR